MQKLSLLVTLSIISVVSFAQIQRVTSKTIQHDSTTKTLPPVNQPSEDNTQQEINKKELMKELNLSKEQKGKLKEIHQANKAKKDEIMNNDKLSDTEKQEKIRELKKQQAESTQTILNEEQKEKMRSMRGEMIKKHRANNKTTTTEVN